MVKIIATISAIALICAAIYFGPDLRQHFGKRYADADREIHQTSLSFVRGTAQNLQRYKLAHETAAEAHRAILRQTSLTEASTVDESKLPPHLRAWLAELRRTQ